jgi:hypothetical protein
MRESELQRDPWRQSFRPDPARETVFPVRSGTERFRPERFYSEKGISSREIEIFSDEIQQGIRREKDGRPERERERERDLTA